MKRKHLSIAIIILLIFATVAFAGKISEWTLLSATPADGDWVPITDISDTTQGAGGTSKRVSYSDFFGGRAIGVDIQAWSIYLDSLVTDMGSNGGKITGSFNLDLSAPGVIGNTTPAAGTFTTLTAHSLTIPQSATAQGTTFYEPSGDGTNTHTLQAQAFAANYISLLPDYQIGFLNSTQVSTTGEMKLNTVGSFSTPITTNPYTLTAANSYNAQVFYGATGEVDLPALVDGMAVVIYNTGAFTITIDPNGAEVITRDGTAQTGGVSMTLDSGAGNFVCLVSDGTQWVTLGYKGTLAEGS